MNEHDKIGRSRNSRIFRSLKFSCALVMVHIFFAPATASAQFMLEQHTGGVRVLHKGKVVADYLTMSKSKPIIWPLLGPGGASMTRDYPMIEDSENEKHDHPHHRSLWMTHGDVNGTDFWLEGGQGGIIKHQKFGELRSGDEASISTENLWTTAAGKPVLSDKRRFTFAEDATTRWLDCEFKLIASHGDVNFGDTKEGSFGIRIAESMKVDAQRGGKIINSQGDSNKDAWGVPAKWVDYVGPVTTVAGEEQEPETYGIAILCHPSTFNFPNRWHVRTYGLFAANPFGVHHFTGKKEPTEGVDLKAGDSMVLRYRVLLHRGDTEQAKVAEHYKKFAATQFDEL